MTPQLEPTRREPGRLARRAWSVLLVVVALGLVAYVGIGERFEAHLNAVLLNNLQIASAEVVGASVLFLRGETYGGYTVDAGCTATLLVVPFFLVTAALMGVSRLSSRRCLGALGVATVLIFAANQARLLVIAGAMRTVGGERGYESTHVFLGTVVSTIGVLIGAVLYFSLLAGWRPRRRRPASPEGAPVG